MSKILRILSLIVCLFTVDSMTDQAFARGNHHGGQRHSHSYRLHSSHRVSCVTCARNQHGRIKRSSTEVRHFKQQTGYPHGRKGYVVDHITPLKRGGADKTNNMQWQTKQAAKLKDKTE